MRALVIDGAGEARVTEVADPDREDWALLRVERVGVCGTDASIFKGNIPVPYPLIMGHEMVGTIERPGPLGLAARGQRVTVDPTITCGYCDLCRADRTNLCRNGGLLGRDLDGVFSELVAVPERLLHPLPESIDPATAPVLQVLGTCVHAQDQVRVFPGDTAVVVGLGVTGLLHLQLLRARGVEKVIGVTRSEWKQDLAKSMGAALAVGPADAQAAVMELSDGRGASLVVECAGYETTLSQAIELTGPGGSLILFGTLTGGGSGLPYYQLYIKELSLHNPRAALPRDYARGVALAAAGHIDFAPLVTHRLPLTEGPSALATLLEDPSALKVIFEVN